MPITRPFTLSALALSLATLAPCAAWSATALPNADGEVIPETEAADTAATVSMIRDMVQKGFDTTGHAFRDAHRKAHGCVKARFTVAPQLPPTLAQGLFAQARSYDAVIRYSNGSQVQDDTKGDARGMAIKVMGVDGPKLLGDEAGARTQDFLLMNHPVFFVRNARDYVGFQKAISGGAWTTAGWLTTHIFHEGAILLAIQNRKMTNPLNARYWSTTPSRLGTQQVKYSAVSCTSGSFTDVSTGPDLLRENMEAHLARQGACFDFKVQTRTQPTKMPIEDPTIEWKESAAPFTTVARIEIPPQQVEQGEACEIRSFTPWHSLAEHRPLGGIQRVRKATYLEISRLRHDLNGQPRVEP
ncbi:MAG TPA: catalase family protein [Aquabacterium sp.]|uniref:catalase family protein n=1 Tax=Aquabacterium sp. TaxID=1872578 RepID=UPI002E32C099|nr:catalase family protein [Aquabacterium sp.]HEX5373929.1 catalase family protein [Aquabacterium sp.]